MNQISATNILHIFASNTWAGGEQYVFDLAQRQIAEGHSLTLVSGASRIIKEKTEALDCNCYVLTNRGRFNIISILQLRKILIKNEIDVIHVHQFRDGFIAAFAVALLPTNKKPKIILTRHLIRKGKSNVLYRWLYRHIHRFIFVSAFARREFLSTAQVDENKISVIHNSMIPRPRDATHTDYRKLYHISDSCVVVGFVGRIVEFKGVELLLEVAGEVKDRDIVFLLAGTGAKEYVACLKEKIAEKNMQQRFILCGFIHNTTELIAQTDIGILPSICRESFGLTILEFMQAGIPVIASNSGAQGEFLRDQETGLLVNPTVPEILQALLRLLDHPDLGEKMGRNAKLSFDRELNYEVFFHKVMQAYQ